MNVLSLLVETDVSISNATANSLFVFIVWGAFVFRYLYSYVRVSILLNEKVKTLVRDHTRTNKLDRRVSSFLLPPPFLLLSLISYDNFVTYARFGVPTLTSAT